MAGEYFRFSREYPDAVQYALKEYRGIDVHPGLVENAIRNREFGFYNLGQHRYTTLELLDDWLETRKVEPGVLLKPSRKPAETQSA